MFLQPVFFYGYSFGDMLADDTYVWIYRHPDTGRYLAYERTASFAYDVEPKAWETFLFVTSDHEAAKIKAAAHDCKLGYQIFDPIEHAS